MEKLKIAVVAPCSPFDKDKLELASKKAYELGLELVLKTEIRNGKPAFLNGDKDERLKELSVAERLNADGIWCVRGGCGAITLWHDYQKGYYESYGTPLIGYSDVTILHFLRFYRANRIGVHGPSFLDLANDDQGPIESLQILLKKQAHNFSYPPLKPLNHFVATKLSGELVVMNLVCLQAIIGGFEPQFLRGKILAIEDVNEPHYRVFESLYHLKNVGALLGLKALLIGHFGKDRPAIIAETLRPLADELAIPLFDWPIFGHELPNWPLLFGAKSTIKKIDQQFFTLVYDEQHDHAPIAHE